MTLSDNLAVKQIIGGLMQNTLLFLEYPDIEPYDFENKVARICFLAIRNLYKLGAKKLTIIEVEDEVLKNEGEAALIYRQYGGVEFLKVCYEIAESGNFKIYYNRLKKYSLLRQLNANHYDISDYFKEDKDIKNPYEEIELQKNFDEASIEDILNSVEKKFSDIKKDYVNGHKTKTNVAEGIDDLIEDLKKNPDNGPMLEGDILNLALRGARGGKFYLRSASSNVGKSRTAIFDACRLAYPIKYSYEKDTFVKEITSDWRPVEPRKVLFIVTEMGKDEIQTIILAYLAGVNEEHILTNRYENGEEERIAFAKKIMKKYSDYFIFEEISEPNLINVEATIKKYIMVDGVQYIFFDYIHSTPSMLAQFERSGLREESILMMMSNQLKQIAKDYNVFIYSATQVNSIGMADDGEFKNMMSIRGAKSIADKIDVGYVITKISDKVWNDLVGNLKVGVREGIIDHEYLERREKRPTHIFDLYKNRRGRLKDIRIWSRLDLGTGERKDLFMTTSGNIFIKLPNNEIFKTNTERINNWQDMIEKGIDL